MADGTGADAQVGVALTDIAIGLAPLAVAVIGVVVLAIWTENNSNTKGTK